jgi:hypothetical protein
MSTNITVMPTMDMTSDERHVFYAVEWLTDDGHHAVDVYHYEESRDSHAKGLSKAKVVVYDIVCPFSAGQEEAEDFARDNAYLKQPAAVHQADRREMEIAIVTKLVNTAIHLGYEVSVYDGEAWPIKHSTFALNVLAEMFATSEESLHFHSGKRYIGVVDLVYGNEGWTVIADNTESAEMTAILAPAEELARQLEFENA